MKKLTLLHAALLALALTSTLAFSSTHSPAVRRIASVGESTTYFENCNNPNAGGTTLPFSGNLANPVFRPECAPDTLYSWQFEINLNKFMNDPLFGRTYLYTWRTPLSTFGYGDQQIRIKLKKDIKFRWIDSKDRNCGIFSPEEAESTVFVAWITDDSVNMVDYLLCSGKVADSWSRGTRGAGMEAENELKFVKAHVDMTTQNYDAYAFGTNRTRLASGYYNHNPYFVTVDEDVKSDSNWTEVALEDYVQTMDDHTTTDPHIDHVYYADEAVDPSLRKHFSTNVRSYFRLTERQLEIAIEHYTK